MQVAQFPAYTQEGFQPWHVDPQGPVYVLSTSGHDTQALHRFDPATKRMEPEPLVTLRDFDLAPTAEIDVPSHRLLGLHFLAEQAGSYWFDKDMRKLQQSIDAALPADRTNLIYCGRCASTRFLVVKSSSDRQPGEYYFFDRKELKPGAGIRPENLQCRPRRFAASGLSDATRRSEGGRTVACSRSGPWRAVRSRA